MDREPMEADKKVLRRTLRSRRRAFVEAAGTAQLSVHAIVMAQVALAAAGNARSVTAYLASEREVDAMPAIQLALARGMITALPYIAEREGPMRFRRWQPGERLITGPYGMLQPSDESEDIVPDAIFAPLLGFDRRGNRIGQGGGFYDGAFVAFPAARRIGLAWSVQEVDALPIDSWDQTLHATVTEREQIEFS